MKTLSLLAILGHFLLLVACADPQANYKKFPETINAKTGLREFKMQTHDCINTPYEHIESRCSKNEVIEVKSNIREKADKSSPKNALDLGDQKVIVHEKTPWLDQEKEKTVVEPSIQFDEKSKKVIVATKLRIKDANQSKGYFEVPYTFEGSLKTFRQNYARDSSTRYIKLDKVQGGRHLVNGLLYCVQRPKCHKVALLLSFTNVNEKAKTYLDSRTFRIDARESAFVDSDAIPGQAKQRTHKIEVEKVTLPNIKTDEADPESSALFENVLPPILPYDSSGHLCEGFKSKEACPKYLFDPTIKNPNKKSKENKQDSRDDLDDIELKDENPQKDSEQIIIEVPETSDDIKLKKASYTPDKRQNSLTEIQLKDERPDDSLVEKKPIKNQSQNQEPKIKSSNQQERVSITDIDLVEEDAPQTNPSLPDSVLRPKQRPDDLDVSTEEDQDKSSDSQVTLPESVLRPRARPKNLGRNMNAKTHYKQVNLGVKFLKSVDRKFTYDLSKCSKQLYKLRFQEFDQAKGFYSDGRLQNAKIFATNFSTNRASQNRKQRQYASGITHLAVEFAACVLEQRYKNVRIDIHDFSDHNGGPLRGHGSHQNGLDVDVSYPHLNQKTSGFDSFLNNADSDRVALAIDYARILYATDRVHILFTDRRVKNKMCNYVKRNGNSKSLKKFINDNLRHIGGHYNHFHIRTKCTNQNEYCTPQGRLRIYNKCT